MATQESRIDKINKLLAQAADLSVTVKEAERFAEHAAKLMARHSISEAMLAARRGDKPGITERLVPAAEPYAREQVVMVAHIAAALHCRTVYLRSRAIGTITGALLMGAPDDVERVLTLNTLLWGQAWRGVMSDPALPWTGPAAVKRYQRNWLRAFAAAVGARLKMIEDRAIVEDAAERAAAHETGPSTALVIRGKDAEVDRYYDDAYGQAAESDGYAPPTPFDHGALNGLTAGRNADIGLKGMEG